MLTENVRLQAVETLLPGPGTNTITTIIEFTMQITVVHKLTGALFG
jgi:hypothetical protein